MRTMTMLIIAAFFSLSCNPLWAGSAGYTVDLNASGFIDAAVAYSTPGDHPDNAEFVDGDGIFRLGDFVSMHTQFTVHNASLTVDSLSGSFSAHSYSATFGGVRMPFGEVDLRHDGYYLAPGQLVYNLDVIEITRSGLHDGIAPNSIWTSIIMYAKPGTLVDTDGRIVPDNMRSFRDAVIGVQMMIDVPISLFGDVFITSPYYTITPAPGTLAALVALVGTGLAARRRRQPECRHPEQGHSR